MKTASSRTLVLLGIFAILFLGSLVLFGIQVGSGSADPDNTFLRITVSGFGAATAAALLLWFGERAGWKPATKFILVAFTVVAGAWGIYLLADAIWLGR